MLARQRAWDPSCQGLGPKTPLLILGPVPAGNHNRQLLDPSSHPWGPVMGAWVRKAYHRKQSSVGNSASCISSENMQMMWWIRLDSALVGAEHVTESKTSRHLEIQTFGRIKAPFAKHCFPDLDVNLANPSRWGEAFYLQLELFCLQLSFFAYSPLRRLLDALSHCKCKAKTVSEKAPTVSKKAKIVNCK